MQLSVRSRRGSYIVEASAVLPFVILSVITTVLIILYFYDSSVSECRMHRALRCEAGIMTGKVTAYAEDGHALSPEDLWDGSITASGAVTSRLLCGSKSISMVSDGLLSRLGRRGLTGQLRVVDPVRALRLRQMLASAGETSSGSDP